MDAAQALDRIAAAGIVLRINGTGENLAVESDQPLTDQQRAFIREHKAALLLVLRQREGPQPLTADERAETGEAIEERAAIREFDGNESRDVAERQALSAMRVYRCLVRMDNDKAPAWVTMFAPGCSIEDARKSAEWQWPGRVLELRNNRQEDTEHE